MSFFKLAISVTACTLCFFASGNCQTGLKGDVWMLFELVDGNGKNHDIDNGKNYTVEFKDGGQAAIRADCNDCGSNYTSSGEELSMSVGRCTRKLCSPGSKDQEFLNGLWNAKSWERAGNTLLLKNSSGKVILSFINGKKTSGPDEDLYDDWELESVLLEDGDGPDVKGEYRFYLRKDGGVSYNIDCNGCNGSFTATDAAISLGMSMCTSMACRSNQVESYLSKALMAKSIKYVLQDNRLLILFNDDADTLVYSNGQRTDIEAEYINSHISRLDWRVNVKENNIVVTLPGERSSGSVSLNRINGGLVEHQKFSLSGHAIFRKVLIPGSYLITINVSGNRDQRIIVVME